MYVSSENFTQSRFKQLAIDTAIVIMIALLALILVGPIFARPAHADQLRHTACPSSTTQGMAATMPYIEAGNVTAYIEALRHSDECQH